jgi:hypothetical protein
MAGTTQGIGPSGADSFTQGINQQVQQATEQQEEYAAQQKIAMNWLQVASQIIQEAPQP